MKNRNLLVASSDQADHVAIGRMLAPLGWDVQAARSCQEALSHLNRRPAEVLICERDLPDCGWAELWKAASAAPVRPVFIVASDCADVPLWASVLGSGGFDILARPFLATEVSRVAEAAWREWERRQRTVSQSGQAVAANI
jgi:DNA-binding NtrC family response regulator